jgi:uncharacterized protein
MPRKLTLFLLINFGICWLAAGIFYLLDLSLTDLFGTAFIAVFCMWAPAAAVLIVQKGIYRQSLAVYGWQFKGLRWQGFLGAFLLPPLMVLLAFGFVWLLGNGAEWPGFGRLTFTAEGVFANLKAQVEAAGQALPLTALSLPPLVLLLAIFGSGMLAGATINGFFGFGEELGWRGLMLVETQALGFWRSNALIGLVWGFWHAPIILMGHNYPGYPWAGIGMMMLFCLMAAYPLAYVSFKSRSILAPSIFHGNVNAIAGGAMLFITDANPLGGAMVGTVSVLALGVITLGIVLFDRDFVKQYQQQRYVAAKPASPPAAAA